MWKYIAASLLFAFGALELLLALNGRLREAVMKNSLVRSKRAEPLVLLAAALSAFLTGLAILFYDRLW